MIVIADDITGAAEIAGIAFARGEAVRLVCGCATATNLISNTTVIATDTRSMSEADAIAETRHIVSHLLTSSPSHPLTSSPPHPLTSSPPHPLTPSPSHPLTSSPPHPLTSSLPHLYKKVDSALRGHVVAELATLMQATDCQRAVYLPANPSKGRIIRGGIYYINHVPIHETAFSYDPEFPARTSLLEERFPDAANKGIIMPDAESEEDIRKVIEEYNDGKTIFAGAADLFSALLANHGDRLDDLRHATVTRVSRHDSLILCGSTQSKPLEFGIPIAQMPREIYDGSDNLSLWDTSAYAEQHSLILSIPHTHRTGKDVAVHLRAMMAEKARQLVAVHRPDHLIIEGGATAWATLQALGWTDFAITAQLAPGVVQMSATNGTLVTLKPGSYPWGDIKQSRSYLPV